MTKDYLIEALAQNDDLGLTKKRAKLVVNALFDSMSDQLQTHGKLSIFKFGTFLLRHVPAREVRNPKTQAVHQVEPHYRIQFRAHNTLKDEVNAAMAEQKKRRAAKKK